MQDYGSVKVIHGVDIDIGDGQFVALVRPSGCGKSTLLRMIAGLEEVTGGAISIGDRVDNNLPPSECDIAMTFQNYAFYPHKTVAANMAFSLRMRRKDKGEIEQKVRRAAEILGLTEYLNRYPRSLSSGQRQRVAMGRAIVRDPQVFLFGEPLSNLDAKQRETEIAGARIPAPSRNGLSDGQKVTVGVAEPTRAETHVVCRIGDKEVTAVFRERRAFEAQQTIHLRPVTESIHLFDVESGVRIG